MTIATIGNKPVALDIIGPGNVVFQQLIHLARMGYTIQPGTNVDMWPNGNVSAFLIIGNPTPDVIAEAEKSIAEAVRMQESKYNSDVAAAAAAAVEAYKAEQAQAKIAEEIAAHEKRIRDLQKAAAK